MFRGKEPPAHLGVIVENLGLAFAVLGLIALWWFPASVGTQHSSGSAYSWAALVGLQAILILTWRLWGAPLALAAMAAVFHAATWHHGHDLLPPTAIDAVRDLAGRLWFSLDEGPLGWLLDTMLSTVLPFFILGGLLADRTFLGSPVGLEGVDASFSEKLVAAVHAVARFLAPTVVVGALLMTARPGVDLSTTATAWLLPLIMCLAWFWIMPAREGMTRPLALVRWQDILLIACALIALALALVAGLSPELSAISALGVVLAVSILDPLVRQRPKVTLLALARNGIAFGKTLVAIGVIGLILAAFDRTGLPLDLAQIMAGAAGEARLPLLVLTAIVSIGLGLAMPGIAAYLIAVALIGPSLRTVGIADLTIHLSVLFVCAGASAIKCGIHSKTVSAVGGGIAISGIAFAFASNPELLLVPEAFTSIGRPDRGFDPLALGSAILRTGCMIYLLAASSRLLEWHRQGVAGAALRVVAGMACVAEDPLVYGAGLAAGVLIIATSQHAPDGKPKAA